MLFVPGQTAFFDVDDTLVLWRDPGTGAAPVPGLPFPAWAHREHLELLVKLRGVGYAIVVWSHGGADWAARVVEALDIASLVSVVCAKPSVWFDDHADPTKILGPQTHRYLGVNPHDESGPIAPEPAYIGGWY